MMTPEEFTNKHYQLDKTQISMVTLESATHLAKAYSLHVLERVDKEAEELSGHVTYPDGSTERYISSYNLKQIFEEIKKELK